MRKKRSREEELKEIVDELITKSFPELLDEDIQVKYAELKDVILTTYELDPEGYCIEVDNLLRDAPKAAKIGGIAHELAEIVHSKKIQEFMVERLSC